MQNNCIIIDLLFYILKPLFVEIPHVSTPTGNISKDTLAESNVRCYAIPQCQATFDVCSHQMHI